MSKKSLFNKNKEKILSYFNLPPYFFSDKDIIKILSELKEKSLLPKSTYFNNFLLKLLDEGLKSHNVKIKEQYYIRYSFESKIDPYKIGINLIGNKSFLSMSTALNFMGYTNYREEIIFVSNELTKKTLPKVNTLTQISVDKAFRNTMPRFSSNISEDSTINFVLLSPKFSNNYEVITNKEGIRYSSINRAFIEMIINVQYYKTDKIIIDLFKPIKNKLDIKKIYKFLEKVGYIYPYHQSVGYYLEEIGFSKNELSIFKKKITNIDFYTQKMKPKLIGEEYDYNEYWKLYH